jgi:hypothetical protein
MIRNKNDSSFTITASIRFGKEVLAGSISTELWMSPTETEIYSFLVNMEKFLNN